MKISIGKRTLIPLLSIAVISAAFSVLTAKLLSSAGFALLFPICLAVFAGLYLSGRMSSRTEHQDNTKDTVKPVKSDLNSRYFNELPLPMFRTSFDGRMVAMNDAFRDSAGIPSEIGPGALGIETFIPDSIEREYLFGKIKSERIVKSLELHLFHYDKSEFDALVSAYIISDGNNKDVIEFNFIDITSMKLLERERRKLESLQYRTDYMDSINKLAAAIAHDINNILAAIQGHAEVLEFKLEKEDPLQTSIQRIVSSVGRADLILEGLMSSVGAYNYVPEEISLISFVEEILKSADLSETGFAGRCRFVPISSEIRVNIDSALIKEAFIEVLKNAGQASGNETEIVITAGLEKPHHIVSNFLPDYDSACAFISVTDKGPGISAEIRDKIFEPFFTTREFGSGAGLGLTKLYGIIQKHDGAIGISGENGNGNTVTVYFQLADRQKDPVKGGRR